MGHALRSAEHHIIIALYMIPPSSFILAFLWHFFTSFNPPLVLDVSLGCVESNLLRRLLPFAEKRSLTPWKKMNQKCGRLRVLWILWLPIEYSYWVSPVLPVGCDVPGDVRILPLCWRGICSRVVALQGLALPLGTCGRQGVWQRAFWVRLQGLV